MNIQTEMSDQAILEELGKRIAQHRLNENLTQEELAKEAGIGTNTIYRIEQGHSTQLSNLVRILRALKMVSNLNGLIDAPPLSPIQEAKSHKKERRRASWRKNEGQPAVWKWQDES